MSRHHRGAYYMPTTPWTAKPKQEIDKEAYFRQIQRLDSGSTQHYWCRDRRSI